MPLLSPNSVLRKPVVRQLLTITMLCVLGYTYIELEFRFWRFFTIAIGAYIAISRYKTLGLLYRPLIFYVLIRLVWHTAEQFLIKYDQPVGLYENIFSILEFVLLSWQLVNWLYNDRIRKLFPFILAAVIALWLCETMLVAHWQHPAYYTHILGYLLLAPAAVHLMAGTLRGQNELLQNSVFLCSLSIVIAAPLVVVMDSVLISGMERDMLYTTYFFLFRHAFDIVFNIFYSNAILCIPRQSTSYQS